MAGVSQPRTARSARGQRGGRGCDGPGAGPPLSGAAGRGAFRLACWGPFLLPGEPGLPAEGERAGHQQLVAADRGIGADLEVGPAEFVLDLLVALLDPVAAPVDPHDL